MRWLSDGAELATIATRLSAVTAAVVWTQNQVRTRRKERDARTARNWHGYVMPEGIDTWYVRPAGAELATCVMGHPVTSVLSRRFTRK